MPRLFLTRRSRFGRKHATNKSGEVNLSGELLFGCPSTNPQMFIVAFKKFNLKTRRYLLRRVVNTVYGRLLLEPI